MQFNQINKSYTSFLAIVLLLVSGVAQAQCNFFTGWADNKDGTVTDTRNGLIWKRCAEGFEFSNGTCTGAGRKANWEDAVSLAKQSHFLDKSDWRLPTKNEFEFVLGTYDNCVKNKNGEYAASKAIAPDGNISWPPKFWSSSPYVSNSSYAWNVNFSNGDVDSGFNPRSNSYYVRLVRDGQMSGGEISLEFVNEILEKEGQRRAEAPKILSAMSKEDVCVAYGKALRDSEVEDIGSFPDILKLVKKETARRKIKLDDMLVRKASIKIGISECQLYASLGMPLDQNRTVGGWGVHIQHVFGNGTYVYTENGRVTSWQN